MNIHDLLLRLESLKVKHFECEDSWYSCPKSEGGNSNDCLRDDYCNCGADLHNKKIDDLIEEINSLTAPPLIKY